MAVRGRPFEKGKSANPGGRKKADHSVTKLARENCKDMISLLVEIANDGHYAINSRVRAAEIVLNRGLGMPRQSVELSGSEGESLNLSVVLVSAKGVEIPIGGEAD